MANEGVTGVSTIQVRFAERPSMYSYTCLIGVVHEPARVSRIHSTGPGFKVGM